MPRSVRHQPTYVTCFDYGLLKVNLMGKFSYLSLATGYV